MSRSFHLRLTIRPSLLILADIEHTMGKEEIGKNAQRRNVGVLQHAGKALFVAIAAESLPLCCAEGTLRGCACRDDSCGCQRSKPEV